MNHEAIDRMLASLRKKNSVNPFFKSKLQSMTERQEKDAAGEFFRISEKYLMADSEAKKKLVNLGIVFFKLQSNNKKSSRVLFYALNKFKRDNGFSVLEVPAYATRKLSYE